MNCMAADGLDEEVEHQISGKVDNVVVLSALFSQVDRRRYTQSV